MSADLKNTKHAGYYAEQKVEAGELKVCSMRLDIPCSTSVYAGELLCSNFYYSTQSKKAGIRM